MTLPPPHDHDVLVGRAHGARRVERGHDAGGHEREVELEANLCRRVVGDDEERRAPDLVRPMSELDVPAVGAVHHINRSRRALAGRTSAV
jgi:hypothetical protein